MVEGLATRLKQLRQDRGWSLQVLAERSGVSVGMLSEIERGTKNPTVRLAYQVAQALGCSISTLVDAGAPLDAAVGGAVVAGGPAAIVDDPEQGVRREGHINPLLHGRLEVVTYRLEPGASAGEMAPNQPGTLETVVVLDGELELVLDGAAHRLATGASAAHGVHRTEYRNPSAELPCRFLVLVDTSRC